MTATGGSSAGSVLRPIGRGGDVREDEVLHVGRPNIGSRAALAARIERIQLPLIADE